MLLTIAAIVACLAVWAYFGELLGEVLVLALLVQAIVAVI